MSNFQIFLQGSLGLASILSSLDNERLKLEDQMAKRKMEKDVRKRTEKPPTTSSIDHTVTEYETHYTKRELLCFTLIASFSETIWRP